jgi:thymidylate kinase
MNIVLEGVDATGKSTLAYKLSRTFPGFKVQLGLGPPKTLQEIEDRIERYLGMTFTIFDRHPCVSQMIYDAIRGGFNMPGALLINRFYDSKPLLIYCDPKVSSQSPLAKHRRGEFDTDEHIAAITKRYDDLLRMYRLWAVQNAHLIYRIGDPLDDIHAVIVDRLSEVSPSWWKA